jgi:hypothetical protein
MVGGLTPRGPGKGGVFEVLQKASFDPRITEGPPIGTTAPGCRFGGDRADDVPPDGQRSTVGGRTPLILVGLIASPPRPPATQHHKRLAQGPPRDPRRPVCLTIVFVLFSLEAP